MSEIKMSCKGCCFFDENPLDSKDVIYHCKLDKLKILQQNGATITIQDNTPFISGRICNTKRNKGWLDKYEEKYQEQLDKEIEIEYGVITEVYSFNPLKRIISQFEQEKITPKSYYIVYYGKDLKEKHNEINLLLNNTNKKWFIKIPIDLKVAGFADELVKLTIKEPFIYYITENKVDIFDTDKINNVLNKDLKQVMLFTKNDCMFSSSMLFRILGIRNLPTEIKMMGHQDKIWNL